MSEEKEPVVVRYCKLTPLGERIFRGIEEGLKRIRSEKPVYEAGAGSEG